MKKQFVPYEIALTLKEKGFDEPCFATYNHEQKLDGLPLYDMENNPTNALEYTWINSKVHNSICCAPLWQQVIDWLRDVKKVEIIVESGPVDLGYSYHIYYTKDGKNMCMDGFGHDELEEVEYNYPQCRQKAVEHALTIH
jgi:hypothetical protein